MTGIKKKILGFILICFLAVTMLPAQNRRTAPGEDLAIKIAVMGPGDEMYFWWGHITLVIENTRSGQSYSYDYGLFSFDNENFFFNFAFGRLLYSSGVSMFGQNVASYIFHDRSITLYTLDISPEKRAEVLNIAETNILPENRNYYYHHFRDNCSHRIRDIIDIATDGQFREKYGDAPGRFTFRQHVRRHTWFSPFFDWILNFWMGQDIDKPITVWDEMFLPSEIGKRINELIITDSNGISRPLVSNVEVIYESVNRPTVLDIPRMQWPRELLAGIIIMAALAFFFFLQTKSPVGQVLLGLSQSLLGLFFGIAALLLYFMALFTNHDYTYHNMNMLFASPLLLAAVPFGIRYAISSSEAGRVFYDTILRILWLLVLLGIVVSMLLKLLPWFWQANLTDELFMLPFVLILALEPFGFREFIGRIFWRWL